MSEAVERFNQLYPPKADSLKVADLLDRSAVRVEAGWQQGPYAGSDETVCVIGAIGAAYVALGGPPTISTASAYRSAVSALREYLHRTGQYTPVWWNDAPGRTADEVASTLRMVATLIRHGGVPTRA